VRWFAIWPYENDVLGVEVFDLGGIPEWVPFCDERILDALLERLLERFAHIGIGPTASWGGRGTSPPW